MELKKFLSSVVVIGMIASLAGCNGNKPEETQATTQQADSTATLEPVDDASAPSIDFEDGLFGFTGMDMSVGNADASELSVVDFNGSKALEVAVQSKSPYVIIDVGQLFGEKVADISKITMDIAVSKPDGDFNAVSGIIRSYVGDDLTEKKDNWSVYIDSKNPNKATAEYPEGQTFAADSGAYIVVSKEVDTGADKGGTPANIYIDNIRVYDAAGSVMQADTSAVYVPKVAEDPWAGLTPIKNETEIEGFATSAGAWAQSGVHTVNDGGTFDASVLKPGDILTIYYSSQSENDKSMWFVGCSSGNPNGDWMRICAQDCEDSAAYSPDGGKCQITYEQIVAVLGEDFASTLVKLECESDADWEVYKVTYGQEAQALYGVANETEIEDFATSAGAWAQAGVPTVAAGGKFDPTVLQPGDVVTIYYSNDSENVKPMWLVGVSSGNPNGDWLRICSPDNDDSAIYDVAGGKCQITYEQIVATLGDDFASTLQQLQCESDADWEVYKVTYGQAIAPYKEAQNQVEIDGFATKADAWAQSGVHTVNDGGTFDPSTLKPGDILTISFSTESTSAKPIWFVGSSSGNPNGDWLRICSPDNDDAGTVSPDGKKCQITYEQIVATLGEDFASTLLKLECESDGNWEVYSVTVGTK